MTAIQRSRVRIENINKNKNYFGQINQQKPIHQIMKTPAQQIKLYQKLRFLSSIPSANPYPSSFSSITDSDIFEICQYSSPEIIIQSPNRVKIETLLSNFRDKKTGDSCLHIAGKASNTHLVEYLVDKKLVNSNELNKKQQNALFSVLQNNENSKAEKIAYILAITTDLKHRNSDQKRVYEIGQSRMDPMRARLLDHLKKSAI